MDFNASIQRTSARLRGARDSRVLRNDLKLTAAKYLVCPLTISQQSVTRAAKDSVAYLDLISGETTVKLMVMSCV